MLINPTAKHYILKQYLKKRFNLKLLRLCIYLDPVVLNIKTKALDLLAKP
jgi:hypothetical protein